ncbi:hypothetical protein [Helicobacter felis]|uniref:hypothetical protein n=1 Tax=Helicobacter felis TaxID=214 RepID=UPI000CF07A8F|nr:hypothetical protein [Helicobacter felis]
MKGHNTLKSLLGQTTANLQKELEGLNLNPADIKGVFDDLDKGTQESYKDAMERVIKEALGDSKVKLDPNTPYTGEISYNQFKAQLKEQGLLAEAKPFLKFIESNVYSKEGVNFTQLENARQMLNSYYKNAQNPNLRDHIQKGLENFLREDIKAGTGQLFKELPPQVGAKYEQLFHTALKDYAVMKQTLKHVDKIHLRDAHTSQEQALDALIKFAKGQGEEGLDNFSKLTKGLSKHNREVLELNMLHRIFQRSLIGQEDLKVFDSAEFFKRLGKLTEGTFSTRGAKDFIEIAQGFHRLFNQDANILRSLKPTTGGKIGSSIATSVSGAVQFQVTKSLFDLIVRTAPHIPFVQVLNDKVSAAALRHHIKSALHKSYSIADFKQHLRALGQRVEFDNATKALIREIEGGLPPDDTPPGGVGVELSNSVSEAAYARPSIASRTS